MGIARVGTEIYNLLRLGFLKAESAGSDRAIKAATTKYNKAVAANPEFARAESIRLNGDTDRRIQDLGERTIITPESLLGNVLVPVAGDRTVTGQALSKSQGFGLLNDVNIKGGPRFPIEHQDKGLGWASMEGAAKQKQKNFDLAARETDNPNVVGVYNAMGDEANNFATPIADVIIQQLSGNKIPKEVVSEFDDVIRQANPNWVGINHPEARSQLMGIDGYPQKGAGALRSRFTKLAGMAKYRDKGFPSRERIRDDVVEPDLLGARRGDSGFTMFDAVPDGQVTPFAENPSYDTGILGQFRGGLTESVPAEVMFPDVFSELSKKINKAGNTLSRGEILGSLVMDPKLYQKADQKWLDNIASYLEKNQGKLGASMPAMAVGLLSAGASDDSEAGVASVAKRLIASGYPDSTAMKIATGELPMDQASRMARATEQGKTEVAYHVGNDAVRLDADGMPIDGTSDQGILNLDSNLDLGWNENTAAPTGTFASGKQPHISQGYARGMGRSPTSYPLLVDTRNFERTDAKGNNWGSIWQPDVYGPDGHKILDTEGYDPTAALYDGRLVNTDMLARGAATRGASGTVIDNVVDVGPNPSAMRAAIQNSGSNHKEWYNQLEKNGGQVMAINDGTKARSLLSAAFDPDQLDSTNILASNPAATGIAGVLGLLGLTPDEAEEMPLEQLFSPQNMSMLSSIASQADIDGSTIEATPQSYSSRSANAMAEQMGGNQASRNRRAQSLGGILDFSPVGGADTMREGKRLRDEGNTLEGLLYSILGAAEFVPVAGQAVGKAGRAGLGLLR